MRWVGVSWSLLAGSVVFVVHALLMLREAWRDLTKSLP